MYDRLFPILGGVAPPMLGRSAIKQRLTGALTKGARRHLQVVGPRFAGKTVVLQNLVATLQQAGSSDGAVVYWDLAHQTPETDDAFMKRFAVALANALPAEQRDYADHLRSDKCLGFKDVLEVVELLGGACEIIAVLDGFEKPLSRSQITRNVYDQLRELAIRSNLWLVTGSRKPLQELLRDPDTEASEFFNIFDPSPVRVGPFDDADVTAVLSTLGVVTLSQGAKTELLNATNGFPILMLEVLNALLDQHRSGEVTPAALSEACDTSLASLGGYIGSLWDECPQTSKDLFLRVVDEQAVSRGAGVPAKDAETLIERGFVHQAANRLVRPCRLLLKHLESRPNEGSALIRLFGTAGAYQRNMKGALEKRIAQIDGLDKDIRKYLERGVEDLPEHPSVFLGSVHGILERVLTLIWRAECWSERLDKPQIHDAWFDIWRQNQEKVSPDWYSRFPEGGQRLRLLDMITGTQNTDRLARYVTKNTYVLANSLQGFRDFGVHPKATSHDLGTAYAALHVCIELSAIMTAELAA
jgi:hypothetical protein